MSFTVYRSSAGSGKTFSLVREYLHMVLMHPADFRHILAITFTHKAANEMKERVMKALTDLSQNNDIITEGPTRQMQLSLIRQTGLDAQELSRRAGEALSLILHHYSEFSIGTIDSFSHRIIRAFAHDFGLPVSFNVEIESTELLTTAVDLLLEQAGSNEDLTRLLVSFLESRMDEDKSWNIDRELVSFANLLLQEEGEAQIKKLASLSLEDFRAISKRLHARISGIERQFKELGDRALEMISRQGIPHKAFYYGKNGLPGYFMYLAKSKMDNLDPNSNVRKTLAEDKWAGPQATAGDIAAIQAIKADLRSICIQAETLKEAGSASYYLATIMKKIIFPLAVLNEIGRMLENYKGQHNLVHISEFNTRIAMVVMNEPVPFIYERLGEKFHHILIDEFQDTSRLQWFNFVPLMENALAGGYLNLVVGDGKQAIYRWRNGDATQFTSLPLLPDSNRNQLIRQRESLFRQNFREYKLDINYRSSREIVNFNNSFFRWLSMNLDPGLKEVYRDFQQKSASRADGGYIRMDFINGKEGDHSKEEKTINRTEQIISSLLTQGFALQDIAILCRKNSQAGRLARELVRRGFDVVSSESLLLAYSAEVRFITEMIQALFEPSNTIIQASLVNFLVHTGVLKCEKQDFHTFLSGITKTAHPGNHVLQLLHSNGAVVDKELLLTLPVYDLCEMIIRMAGLDKTADPYIQFFLDSVVSFVDKGNHNAADFLKWWEVHKDSLSIVIPEGIDAVRIMTIHKAKGLEFPVVIFPFANESLRTEEKYIWVELPPEEKTGLKTAFLPLDSRLQKTVFRDQYADEQAKSMLDLINVLYVALTRPEEQLYIITNQPPKDLKELKSLPSFFASYLQSEGIWDEKKDTYEFGQFSPCRGFNKKQKGKIRTLNSLPSTNWRKMIRIRQKAPEYWSAEDPSARIDFGSKVHAILAGVFVAADAEEAMRRAILAGSLSREEEPGMRKMLKEVVSHPLLARYFDAGAVIRNEPGILDPEGETSRPDRVIIEAEKAIVIDYKTGRRSNAHKKQIERYGRLLHEIGYKQVKKMLVYLGDPVEVEEIVG